MKKIDKSANAYFYVKSPIGKDDPIRTLDKKDIIGTPVIRKNKEGKDVVVGYIEEVVDDMLIYKIQCFDFEKKPITFEIRGI